MVTQKPRLAFTYIDYVNAPEDRRYELLDGDLVMVPAPKRSHQNALLDLAVDLELLMRRTGMGQVFAAPFDVVLTNTDVVQPDIIFVSTERAHIITEDNVQGAPDLVVEILSPSTANRDRTFKRSLYARHGVKEYWIVDTRLKTIELLLLDGDDFRLAGVYGRGDTLVSPTLGGCALNINAVFSRW